MDIMRLGAVDIAELVRGGKLSAEEAAIASLKSIDDNAWMRAVITGCGDDVLARSRRGVSGALAGVPILVKDMFDTARVRTTYGSSFNGSNIPTATAEAVLRLQHAGAVMVGKSNLDEFAWGTTGQNPHWGTVHNPCLPGRITGGSSAGNAAALAAGLCSAALGTDTGGSVRVPAACCGIVGFKPTPGRIPMRGCRPLSPTLDTAGPMTRTVEDCALLYGVLTDEVPPPPRLRGLRVGLLRSSVPVSQAEGAPRQTPVWWLDEHARKLEALGATVTLVDIPVPRLDLEVIFLSEAARSHADTFPARRADYGAVNRAKWDHAVTVDDAAVVAARGELQRWRRAVGEGLAVDLIFTPTLATTPPPARVEEGDVRYDLIAYTRCFNFLGWAAIAIGGVQIAGRTDESALAAGRAWEEAYGPPSAQTNWLEPGPRPEIRGL